MSDVAHIQHNTLRLAGTPGRISNRYRISIGQANRYRRNGRLRPRSKDFLK